VPGGLDRTLIVRLNRRAFLALSAQVAAVPFLAGRGTNADPIVVETATQAVPTELPTATPTTEPTSTAPAYLDADLHQLVSKQYSLAADYVPPALQSIPGNWLMGGQGGLLRADVIEALEPMMAEAWQRDGVDLRIRS